MPLLLALFACQTRSGDLMTMFTPKAVETSAEAVVSGAEPIIDEAFAARRSQECIDNPLDCPEATETDETAPVVEAVEAVVLDAVDAVFEGVQLDTEEPPAALPTPTGLPSEPAWGVRLLQTLPSAQPPRAALGLSNGDEIIVAPGSMIEAAGLVVIAVGDQTVQLAKVEPVGDHAEIETVTLHALYPR
ncbi:MAG TPA: hypothetical protein QGF58_03340 [Myxococcota bacterium]|nr:hypothetical protein [Myxococcota bacterium]